MKVGSRGMKTPELTGSSCLSCPPGSKRCWPNWTDRRENHRLTAMEIRF